MTFVWSSVIAIALTLILIKSGNVAARLISSMVGHFVDMKPEQIQETVLTTYRGLLAIGITGLFIWSQLAGLQGWLSHP